MTTQELLKLGTAKVRISIIKDRKVKEFMVSAVESNGVIGIAAYDLGKTRPRKGKHYMLSAQAREEFLSKLEVIE